MVKMKKGRLVRSLLLLFCIPLFMCSLLLTADALDEDSGEMPEEYYSMIDELPSDVAQRLPEGLSSNDAGKIGEALEELVSFEYIFGFIFE